MKISFCFLLSIFLSRNTGQTNFTRVDETQPTLSPRIVEIEFLIDNQRWTDYQSKYGQNPLGNISDEINQLLEDTSRYLAKLDHGGFTLHLHKPLELLENSEFKLDPVYKDRRDNETRVFDVYGGDVVAYAFTFQDNVSRMLAQGWKTKPNVVRFILASTLERCPLGVWCPVLGARPAAATEEICLCNPQTYPCIGIFTALRGNSFPSIYSSDSVLLAHELGHALGYDAHDAYEAGYIMSNPVNDTVREWSPQSRQVINAINLECLQRRRPR